MKQPEPSIHSEYYCLCNYHIDGDVLQVTSVPLREGSFFSKSKPTLQKWLLLMQWSAFEIAVTTAAAQIEVTENTACAAHQWFQEVCFTKLCFLQILLLGQGVVVHR